MGAVEGSSQIHPSHYRRCVWVVGTVLNCIRAFMVNGNNFKTTLLITQVSKLPRQFVIRGANMKYK